MTNEERIIKQLLRFGLGKDEIDGLSLRKAVSYIRFYHENRFSSRIFGNATLLSAFQPFDSKYIEMARDYRAENDSQQGVSKINDSYDLQDNEFLYDFSVPVEFRIAKPLSNFDRDVKIKSFSFENNISYVVNLFKTVCSCPDFETRQRSQYPKGDIRRLCKHLMLEYQKSFGLHGLSEFIIQVFKHGYPLRRNLKDFTLESQGCKIIVSYDDNNDWWAVYVKDKTGSYSTYGYSPPDQRFSYNEKPFGIVMLLKPKFKEIYNEIEEATRAKSWTKKITDGKQKGNDRHSKNDGCVFLVIASIIALIMFFIFKR